MFYTIGLLMLFSLILIIFDHKDRYCYLFVMMALGATIAFFSIILHINMFGSYYYYNNDFFYKLDYNIYKLITENVKIPISMNIRLMNAGVALYLFAMPIFYMEFSKSAFRRIKFKMLNRVSGYALFIIPVLSMLIYDPRVSTRAYIKYHQSGNKEFFFNAISAANTVYKLLVLFAMLLPIAVLFIYTSKTKILYMKKRIALLASGLFLFDAIFYMFFYVGPFSVSVAKVSRSGFWIFENFQIKTYSLYFVAPLFAFFIISICMFILLSFRMDVSATPFFGRKLQKNFNLMNDILSETLHSQKNLLFAFQILANKIDEKVGGDKGKDEIDRLKALTDNSLRDTAAMLDSLREIRYHYINNSIVGIVDEAVSQISVPDNIAIEWEAGAYKGQKLNGMFDRYHLSKAFVNVINNSIEAIDKSGRPSGRITVEITYIFNWIVVSITDNGTGIKRSAKNKIFTPHYSSKSGKFNWGLGLSYTYRVVKAHLGQIKIDSRFGKYTSVLIMLPLSKGGKDGQDKTDHCG